MEFTGERLIPTLIPKSNALYKEHINRYEFAAQYVKGATVLDVACGTGYGSHLLASIGASKVFGVDNCEETIEYANKYYGTTNLLFKCMDARCMEFSENYFDVIVSFETFEHLIDQQRFLKEIHRTLKPNGLLILSTPNKETIPKGQKSHTPYHVREFNLEEMLNFLNQYFFDVTIFGQKMGYYTRFYKKLRLLLRYPSDKVRTYISNCMRKWFKSPQRTPGFLRVILYELKHQFTVLPYFDQDPKIKPTYFIFTCRKGINKHKKEKKGSTPFLLD